jgi:hypothetical protein
MDKKQENILLIRFLKRLSVFLIIILMIAWPIDIFISHYLKKSRIHVAGEYLVWEDIYNGKIDAEIAVYGSSRAWIHFSPEILEDSLKKTAYNFGMDGLNFTFQYFRHKEYFKCNTKPKYIIVSGDLFFFEQEEGYYNFVQALPYLLFNQAYYNSRKTFKVFDFQDYYIPLYRYLGQRNEVLRSLLLALNLETGPSYRDKGYKGQDLEWTSDYENAKREKNSIEVKVDPQIRALFEDFIKECKSDGVVVIIVYSPEYAGYRDFVSNRSLIIDTYKSIAEKYDLLFLDYSEDSMCYDKSYFYNATHLKKRGSELFTAKFASDIKPYISSSKQ